MCDLLRLIKMASPLALNLHFYFEQYFPKMGDFSSLEGNGKAALLAKHFCKILFFSHNFFFLDGHLSTYVIYLA